MRIEILSPHVANQIAAGEVIERPASVVKELLENALDAGAKKIHIEIGFGGLNQIKVSDDGEGIVAEDLPLAIASHATSKLRELDDLYVIHSMGFRGEALASISSVARVFIQSCPKGETRAMRLESDEQGTRLIPCARSQGTTVEVRDLFFNAPVRKKFLKSETHEYHAIEAIVKRVAFSKPSVAFTLRHNGKICLQLPAVFSESTERARLTKLLGKTFVDEALWVDLTRGKMRLYGWVSGPQYARSQQDKLWFYINQRMVRDKLILHALRQAYAEVLPEGRYPACVLFLTLPFDEVDVNVHPTKHEVRFSDARAVHDIIRLAITQMLLENAPEPKHEDKNLTHDLEVFQPTYPSMDMGFYQRTPWIVLNPSFAVLIHEGQAHLIDVERLHQLARFSDLIRETLPWEARPLLVPVTYQLPEQGAMTLEASQSLLETFGLKLERLEESSVRVFTIPCALPGLDLARFLNAFCDFIGDEKALIELFTKTEMVNLMAMSDDEQKGLIEYWCGLSRERRSMSLCLDKESCHRVLSCA